MVTKPAGENRPAASIFSNKFSKICGNLKNFTGSLAMRRDKTLLEEQYHGKCNSKFQSCYIKLLLAKYVQVCDLGVRMLS